MIAKEVIERKELTEHPDDLRADGEDVLKRWIEEGQSTSSILMALQMTPELRLDVEQGCVHMGEFDLIPFASIRTYRRGLGRKTVLPAIGWIAMGGVHIPGGRWEPDDMDEIEEARSDYSFTEIVRACLVLRYDRALGHACEFTTDCGDCGGSGCVDPLAEYLKDCPTCKGTAMSAMAQEAVGRFMGEEAK